MIVKSPLRPARSSAVLGRYIDPAGRPREIVMRRGFAGSSLVIDRDAATLGDRRLVAHLAADEPARNATLVCNAYVRDALVRLRDYPSIQEGVILSTCNRVELYAARIRPSAHQFLERAHQLERARDVVGGSGGQYRHRHLPAGMFHRQKVPKANSRAFRCPGENSSRSA